MDPIVVDLVELRALQLPGITLAPGRVIVARVIEADAAGHGQLSVAGGRLAATLPAGVRAGEELRLVVREVSAERIVLQIQAEGLQPPAREQVQEREAPPDAGAQAQASQRLALRYLTRNLGPIDLRFALYPGGAIGVEVSMATEEASVRARSGADQLRSAIAASTGATVGVSVTRPRPPLDVYV